MKKWLRLFIWVGLLTYLFAAFGFIAEKSNQSVCSEINVEILDFEENGFVRSTEVRDLLLSNQKRIIGQEFSNINKEEIEELVNNMAFVKNAQVFETIDGVLNIEIYQRKPMVRILNGNREGYYIGIDGMIFPLSRHYTSRVLIANGFIFEPFNWRKERDLLAQNKGNSARSRVIFDLFTLVEYIYNSELWNAQIAQIFINSNYEFELIPRVGAHVIYFGDISDYKEKFQKLEAMYLYGFPNIGWNQYHTINLKFKNQVVCTKR